MRVSGFLIVYHCIRKPAYAHSSCCGLNRLLPWMSPAAGESKLFQYDKRLRTETEPADHTVIGCFSDRIKHLPFCRIGVKEQLAA